MESTSYLLALKPSYYTIIVQYTIINVRPGNNRLPRYGTVARGNTHFPRIYFPRISGLAWGKHPHSAHLCLARSPHPRRPQDFGNLPTRLSETPYTTIDVFSVVSGVFTPNYPARADPLRLMDEASPPQSGLWQIRSAACGNRLHKRVTQHQFMTIHK